MKLYRFLQAFSIDVAAGSCAMSFLVATILNVEMPFVIYFSLFMSVWLVYTLDHLLDAKKIKNVALTLRHRIHQIYFRPIAWTWLTLFILTFTISVLYLPEISLKVGLIVSIFVIAHVFLVHVLGERFSIFFQKELLIAITYTIGILFGPISLAQDLPGYAWWILVQIFLCAFINLLEFSYFDINVDQKQGQLSVASAIGKKSLEKLIVAMIFIGIVIQLFCFWHFEGVYVFQGIMSGMFATLLFIFLMKKLSSDNDNYRILGDLVFLYPIILLMI